MGFKYRVTVLEELARHGVMPADDTPPDLIHDYINDLYLIEIRALKARLKAGSIFLSEYAKHVEKIRDRYPILSLPLRYWLEPG